PPYGGDNEGRIAVQSPGSANDTPSRRAIFVCQPRGNADERSCAAKILSRIARLAYRRPATTTDVDTLLEFFERGRAEGGSFDTGIQFALERALVDPDFLLRVHRDPPVAAKAAQGRVPGTADASPLRDRKSTRL